MSITNLTDILHKEIDIIQNCINRMASNSFLIKGWFITLILGLITFGYEKLNFKLLITISLIITILCWISDAFFLQLEKKYIKKYNWIIKNRSTALDFQYNLNPNESRMWDNDDGIKIEFLKIFLSKTLVFLYGTIALILIVILLVSLYFLYKNTVDSPNFIIIIVKKY